ncbi:MAG: hypothetical protein FD146_159 [Anaerolineaceae bacterium]|nr:MAG: hypothetical protein FD146_159 [Anaerolineaceae bacterium]
MTENLPQTLTCPSCGAPLDFDGKSALVRCKFCKNVALVPGFPAAQAEVPRAALEEIASLARDGNMVEAIKRYRQLFDVGLKEAKDAVETLAAGKMVEARQTASGPLTPDEMGRVLEEVQRLLKEGNKVEAIRRYREAADVSLTKAKEVVDQVEAALTGIPVPPRPQVAGQPAPAAAKERTGNTSSRLGCWIGLFILLFVGGILAFAFSQPGGPFVPLLIANGPAILLPDNSVAAAFYNVNDESHLVGLVDGENGKLRWRSDPLPGDYVDGIAADGSLIFVASGADLLAFRAADGSLAWQAAMPDRLNYGEANMLVADGRVLTSNLDQSVQAYDAATGALVWSRRLSGYDHTLRLEGGSLVLFDYLGGDYTYSLLFLDPADGSQQRTITPICPANEFAPDSLKPNAGLYFDEAGSAIYLVYDSSPGCIQRLDLASGQVVWQTFGEGWYSFSPNGFTGLLTDTHIYFANGNELLAVDKSSGTLYTLLADEDYGFVPLAVSGDVLLVRARRTRGSERFELRGLDAASGETLWQMDMGDAKPIDPPDEMSGLVDKDAPAWTLNLSSLPAGQLTLFTFQGEPNQLVIQTFDSANGTLGGETIVPLKAVSGDFYSVPTIIGWRGERLYFEVDGIIYCVDVTTGKALFHFR